ncbi:MAG: YceH family protein [Edaphocola sp.]
MQQYPMEELHSTLPLLDAEEMRILGSLMEKSRATPEYYPMTVNGLTAACNQKTSRRPVVQYDEQTVVLALDKLRSKGLVSTATGGGSRTVKHKHNIALHYQLVPAEIAILSMLMLRGPQTPGELNTNSGRLYEFDSLEEVQDTLEKLSNSSPAFVRQLARLSGQKEARYTQLFNEEQITDIAAPKTDEGYEALAARVQVLEHELTELKQSFAELMKEWTGN